MDYKRDANGRYAGSTGSRREPFRGIFAGVAKRSRKDPVREEASATITSMKQADPKKYWSVSHLGEGYRALRVAGKTSRGGQQAGYVAVRDNKDSVDVGGLVALPGSKGVAKAAFAKVDQSYPEHPQTLDAFDEKARSGNINLPALYGKHGFSRDRPRAVRPAVRTQGVGRVGPRAPGRRHDGAAGGAGLAVPAGVPHAPDARGAQGPAAAAPRAVPWPDEVARHLTHLLAAVLAVT